MKSKKVIVLILVILLILMTGGGAFAYIYLKTDMLKSDREIFIKYFSNIINEDGFIDKRINAFSEKKEQSQYENSGTIKVNVQYPDKDIEKIIEKVNKMTINFTGKVDSVNQKVEQNVDIDYGNDVVFPIKYKQDGNEFGLQPTKILKKYVAVRNENINELAKKFGVDIDSDNIEISDIEKQIEFTDDEKEKIKEIYLPILEQNLTDEKFSSIKTEQGIKYTLELNNEQIKEIINNVVEATKENTLIIDKINQTMSEYYPEGEKIDTSILDDINIDIPNLKLSLIQVDKKIKQIIIESGEMIISIEKKESTNSLSYNIKYDMKEEKTETDSIIFTENPTLNQVNAYLNIQYKGLETLSEVQKNYDFGFEIIQDDGSMKYDYEVDTNTIFGTDIHIEPFEESKIIVLNDYDETDVTNFMEQLTTRILQLNKTQMEELGLKEEENPILYTNPITMLGIMIYNMANESTNDINFEQQEIQAFNKKFIEYTGENVNGLEVNSLLKTVQMNNLYSAGTEAHFIKITLDGNEFVGEADVTKTYIVEAIYDEEGYVSEIKVTTK